MTSESSEKLDLLANTDLFRSCSAKEIEYLARLVDETKADEGQVLAARGQVGREFFIIVEGRAEVVLADGSSVTLGPGEFFGEMSLLDRAPRNADVIARTPMRLLVLGIREFSSALAEVPSIARNVMTVLARRLRAVEEGHTH